MGQFAKTFLKPVLRPIVNALCRTTTRGALPDSLPEKLIVAANHESFLDGLLLGLNLPGDPVFVVHSWVAKNFWFRLGLSMVDHVAVDPSNPMAIKSLTKEIEKGRPVVIFPEGRITNTGNLMKIYEGPAFLAAKTGAQILPVRLTGPSHTYFSRMQGDHPKRIFPKIDIAFMPLAQIPMPEAPRAKERRKLAGQELKKLMQQTAFKASAPKTIWRSLCETADLAGKSAPILEDIEIKTNEAGKEEASIRRMSYKGVLRMSCALGRWIESKNQGNARVGILLPNVAPTLGAILGAGARGITPCMLNYTAGPASILSALKASQCKRVVCSRSFVAKAKLEPVIAALEGQNIAVDYLEDAKKDIGPAQKAQAAFDAAFPSAFCVQNDPEKEAVVLFTSGSEGAPKGVVLSHRALMANANQIRSVMDINADDKFLCALPLFHSFGLTAGSLLPLVSGSKLFIYPSPLHYRVIPEIAYSENCTVLFGTNTFLAQYGKFANEYDFNKVRRVIAGAEKLQDSTRELWNDKFGIRIFEGYGATETAPVVSVNTPTGFRKGSVGQILPGVESRIVPVPGIENGGVLQVRGPNLMTGYLKADNPGVIVPPSCESGEGWHDLGDIVSRDSEGYIFIQGRMKRFAKIAGEMISLESAEKIAQGASASFSHACVSKQDPAKGEALILFTTDPELTRDKLLASAKALGLPEIAICRDIRRIDAIPLLGTGKTDYVTLNKLASAPAAQATAEPQAPESLPAISVAAVAMAGQIANPEPAAAGSAAPKMR